MYVCIYKCSGVSWQGIEESDTIPNLWLDADTVQLVAFIRHPIYRRSAVHWIRAFHGKEFRLPCAQASLPDASVFSKSGPHARHTKRVDNCAKSFVEESTLRVEKLIGAPLPGQTERYQYQRIWTECSDVCIGRMAGFKSTPY